MRTCGVRGERGYCTYFDVTYRTNVYCILYIVYFRFSLFDIFPSSGFSTCRLDNISFANSFVSFARALSPESRGVKMQCWGSRNEWRLHSCSKVTA